MSHSAAHALETSLSVPNKEPPATLSEEEKSQFLERVRAVLAAPETAPLMVTPPEVTRLIEELAGEQPINLEARVRVTADWNLQYYYGGHPVACLETPRGRIVLGWGVGEVRALLQGIPTETRRNVVVFHPDRWEE